MKTTMEEKAKIIADYFRIATREVSPDEIEAAVLRVLEKQDRDTRHACAEAVTQLSAKIAEAYTTAGVLSPAAKFACEQLERAAAICVNTVNPSEGVKK